MPGHQTPQIVDIEVRGVDHQIGLFLQRLQHLPFLGDAIRHRSVKRQRMPPSGFGEAAGQHLVTAIEEQYLHIAMG